MKAKENDHPIQGKLVIVTAPSGAGKTSIVHHLLKEIPSLVFSVSATTRKSRPDEVEGKDYYFIDQENFKRKIREGEFLEWEEVYPGRFYGTLKGEVQRIWDRGMHVVFDIDVKGALNIKNSYPDNSLSLFVTPPSAIHLRERLMARKTEDDQSLMERMERSVKELRFKNCFDDVVLNEDLNEACRYAYKKVKAFLSK